MIIWWLPVVPHDIQSESSVDHVLKLCWYTVIICCSCWYSVIIVSWPCINNMLISSDYMMITCCSSWYSVRINSWPCIKIMLIYSDYLMITCCSSWYSVRIISWPCINPIECGGGGIRPPYHINVVPRKMLKEKVANFLWLFLNMWMECWRLLFAVK